MKMIKEIVMEAVKMIKEIVMNAIKTISFKKMITKIVKIAVRVAINYLLFKNSELRPIADMVKSPSASDILLLMIALTVALTVANTIIMILTGKIIIRTNINIPRFNICFN